MLLFLRRESTSWPNVIVDDRGWMFASRALTLFILQISAWKSEAATQPFHPQQCQGILAGLFDPLRIWRSTSVACASCDLMELTGSD
jgi:hypothetical protein